MILKISKAYVCAEIPLNAAVADLLVLYNLFAPGHYLYLDICFVNKLNACLKILTQIEV